MLESGLTFSHAQLVIDNEIVKMIRKVMQGIPVDDENLAVDIIKQVGAGGDFIMQEHTMKYMRTLPSNPQIIDRRNREGWLDMGGADMSERAAEKAREILQNHKPDPLSDEIKSALRSIVIEAEEEFAVKK